MNLRLRTGLACGSALATVLALGAAPAMAQTAGQPAQTTGDTASTAAQGNVDELVVVGSRIRRDNFNSPSPVQVITHEETTLAGFGSTTEALQSTSVTTGQGQINNAYGGYVTNGGPGANTLSLRGLGASRTLVLINGRRVSPAGTRGAVGSADLNVLPSGMIDHVEILKDGASSIYGSDAIAGVVNVITRNRFDGVLLEGNYSPTEHGGGVETRGSVVVGKSTDRWNIIGSFDYFERTDLTLGQRDWTRCQTDNFTDGSDTIDPLTGKSKCYPITGTGDNGVTINTIGTSTTSGIGAIGSNRPGTTGSFNRWRPNSGVTSGLVGFEGVGGGGNGVNVRDTFDPAMLNEDIISPVKVYTGFLQGSYDLQALGNAQVYGEVLVNRRNSDQTGYRQLSLDYAKGSPLLPSTLAFSNFLPGEKVTNGVPVGVRAFIGFGNDHSSQQVDYYKSTAGLRGDLTFLPNWKYDTYVSYAKSDADYTTESFLISRLANAMNVVAAPAGFTGPTTLDAQGHAVTCAVNLTNPAAGCVPTPALSAQVIGGQLSSAYRNYIFTPVTGNTQYWEETVSAEANGPVFRLPAGDLKAAVGVEYRRAKINDRPPAESVSGDLYNLTSAGPTLGSDSTWEAYTELEAPIIRDAPFIKDLTLNVSGRYTDYRSYGSDTTYKVGGVWTPNDWISFRATYGTSYRAPALFEQFQGGTTGFLSQQTDPCNEYGTPGTTATIAANCAKELPGQPSFLQTQSVTVITKGGAGSGLKAETSKNLTVGTIVRPQLPEQFGRLELALDYFDILVENGVSQLAASTILDLCYSDPAFQGGQGYCRFVHRDAGTGGLTVDQDYVNVAQFKTQGYDFNLRWQDEIGPGRVLINLGITRYMTQATKNFSDVGYTEFNGTIGSPKWAGSLDAQYKVREWTVDYGVDWVGGAKSYDFLGVTPADGYKLDVPDYFVHRLSVQYKSDQHWAITAGVRNLFDKVPPSISGATGYYDRVGNAPLYSEYDYYGRRLFVTVSKQF